VEDTLANAIVSAMDGGKTAIFSATLYSLTAAKKSRSQFDISRDSAESAGSPTQISANYSGNL
jgi:hypothetical protein